MQLLCLRLSQLLEEGKMADGMASLAKMQNARRAREVVADAREMLGDAAQSLIVGREITGFQAFSR